MAFHRYFECIYSPEHTFQSDTLWLTRNHLRKRVNCLNLNRVEINKRKHSWFSPQESLTWYEALDCVSTSVTDSTALTVMEILLCCRIQQERMGTPSWGLCIKINAAAETLSQPGIKTNLLPKCLTVVKSNNNLSDSEQRRWITRMDYICPAWFHNHLY